MDSALLDVLEKSSESELNEQLKKFNGTNANTMSFPDFRKNVPNKQRFVDILMKAVVDENYRYIYGTILQTIRILVRDKHRLDILVTERNLLTISHLAGYDTSSSDTVLRDIEYTDDDEIQDSGTGHLHTMLLQNNEQHIYYATVVEAQKSLCRDLRSRVSSDLHGLLYLIEVLDTCSNAGKTTAAVPVTDTAASPVSIASTASSTLTNTTLLDVDPAAQLAIPDTDCDLACEVLKVLFNLASSIDKKIMDEEVETYLRRLVSIVRDLLLCKPHTMDKQEELRSHSINLLTAVPPICYEELLTPIDDIVLAPPASTAATAAAASDPADDAGIRDIKDVEFEGKNMEAVSVLLDFLNLRILKAVNTMAQSKELLIPVLSVMCDSTKANRSIRKFLRLKVLPPLRDVMTLPEEGTTMRNKLCRLMTHPVTEVKDLAAEFVFTLCKERVERFIKYTGYGNAAGLLAQKGLMLGRRTNAGGAGGTAGYSSPSDDSDTEEYEQHRDSIDPMTGRVKEQHEDPMAGMTGEQKEYEARKLMEQIDRLQRSGGMRPMRIGADGKPQPVEHVMELLEPRDRDRPPPAHDSRNESDSDD